MIIIRNIFVVKILFNKQLCGFIKGPVITVTSVQRFRKNVLDRM